MLWQSNACLQISNKNKNYRNPSLFRAHALYLVDRFAIRQQNCEKRNGALVYVFFRSSIVSHIYVIYLIFQFADLYIICLQL